MKGWLKNYFNAQEVFSPLVKKADVFQSQKVVRDNYTESNWSKNFFPCPKVVQDFFF